MIRGMGIDIVNIRRIEKIINRWGPKFLSRIFTFEEINYCRQCADPVQHFAARFSAKEAICKALGTGRRNLGWKELEIINNELGKPEVKLSGRAKLLAQNKAIKIIHISLSHEESYAIAQAIAEGGNTDDCIATR